MSAIRSCPTSEQERELDSHPTVITNIAYFFFPSSAAQDGQQQQQQVDGSSTSLQLQQQPSPALSPNQAARSLYPSIARSLQKYLRLTKQTGRHNLQSIYDHLSKCLLYRLSPRTFLEKFLNQDPVWQQSETNLFSRCRLQTDSMPMNDSRRFGEDLEINSWSLVCDTLLSRQISSGKSYMHAHKQTQERLAPSFE